MVIDNQFMIKLTTKQLIVNVGSQNVAKVAAAEQTLKEYEMFKDAKMVGMRVDSGVSEQPLTMEETVQGAVNRAKNCHKDCDFSIGIESGLIPVPHTISGYMNIGVCAIYDGKRFHLGLAPGFEYPKIAIDKVLKDDIDVSAAYKALALTDNEKLGNTEGGIVGKLTKGRTTRKEYSRQAIIMAMIHLENPGLY